MAKFFFNRMIQNNSDLISFESEIEDSVHSLDRLFRKSKISFTAKGSSAKQMLQLQKKK